MLKKQKSILFTISSVITLGCLTMIFLSPRLEAFSILSEFVIQIMFTFIGLGLIALAFNQKRFMVLCLMASASIAFFLKMASNPDLILTTEKGSQAIIKVSLIDLEASEGVASLPFHLIQKNKPHIISFQQYNDQWNKLIQGKLYKSYPYIYKWHPSESEGLAIYSSIPFDSSYTISLDNIPNAIIDFNYEGALFHLVSNYFPKDIQQATTNSDESKLLFSLAEYIAQLKGHVMNVGHFNSYFWSMKITTFRKSAALTNSRRHIDWQQEKIPEDHIFHSSGLKCISLKELYTRQNKHVGLHAEYIISSHARAPYSVKQNIDKKGIVSHNE